MKLRREINAIFAIAQRDVFKFLRDRSRIIATFIFPFVFVAILGGSLQANIAKNVGFNFLLFTFTGVLAQTLFQSTASGIISLIEDRETDFSREIFVSPISRYTIIIGKIIGESLVALCQAAGIIVFGMVIGVPLGLNVFLALLPVALVCCLLGGAFGVLVMSNLHSQRAANQVFPFIILPQYFLSGVFSPINDLPVWLDVLTKIAPMRYAVDFARGLFYAGSPEYEKVVLLDPLINLLIIAAMTVIFILVGTILFVNNEKNR